MATNEYTQLINGIIGFVCVQCVGCMIKRLGDCLTTCWLFRCIKYKVNTNGNRFEWAHKSNAGIVLKIFKYDSPIQIKQ